MQNEISAENILHILNDILKRDKNAITALLSLTVPTNGAILGAYDVRFSKPGSYPEFGLLSILNKIIENSGQKIVFCYDIDNRTFEMINSRFELKNA